MAYADLVCGKTLDRSVVFLHMGRCIVRQAKWDRGLMNRWPDGSGGVTSHDELIGISYFWEYQAKQVLDYLDKHLGEYDNTGEKENVPLQFNLYRFPFFRPYLVAASGGSPSLGSQIVWCIQLYLDANNSDLGGGKLRNWVMMQSMKKFWLCRRAISYWKGRMKRRDITPKTALAIEPKEYPILSELAPEEWT